MLYLIFNPHAVLSHAWPSHDIPSHAIPTHAIPSHPMPSNATTWQVAALQQSEWHHSRLHWPPHRTHHPVWPFSLHLLISHSPSTPSLSHSPSTPLSTILHTMIPCPVLSANLNTALFSPIHHSCVAFHSLLHFTPPCIQCLSFLSPTFSSPPFSLPPFRPLPTLPMPQGTSSVSIPYQQRPLRLHSRGNQQPQAVTAIVSGDGEL
ncbi:unnamed protein product [Closterium sp. NIES-54]